MTSYSFPSPAKLNLFLHINARRADGYHDLQTLFQLLDYGDELHYEINQTGKISCSPKIDSLPEEQNLVFQAAKKLQQATNTDKGCHIQIDKKLPTGGGLGGGSSNAATTLLALNRLWETRLCIDQLAEIGTTLGADVPVFVRGYTAFAEGVGERLTPVETPNRWFLVIKPNCHVSTSEIFSNSELTRDTSPIKIRALSTELGKNDCQKVVTQLYPDVKSALDWLGKYQTALMTGTGACVFACFEDQQEAEQVLKKVPAQWQAFVAKGVNRSALHLLLP